MAYQDYPRMMFHRSKPPVTIHSREEENELGAEWRRTVWPLGGDSAAIPTPELSTVSAVPETDAAPGGSGDDPPGAPHPEPGGPADQVEALRRAVRARTPEPEPEPPPKRHRAPTVKPTGKPKKKSRDW